MKLRHVYMTGLCGLLLTVVALMPSGATLAKEVLKFSCSAHVYEDPMAIIVNGQCPVTNLTDAQVRDIFAGTITSWGELGGPDRPIVVILPYEETAAYRNFRLKVMYSRNMVFHIKTLRSTMVIEAVGWFPSSISFSAHGAAEHHQKDIRICTVNGLAPGNPDYPYYQVFSFVTRGEPAGTAKKCIDFAVSDEGTKVMTKRGMVPYTRLGD